VASTEAISSAEFLRAALKQARVGTWQVDMLSGLSTWDAVASEIMGLPATPMSAGELLPIHPDDTAAVQARFERHAVAGGADDIEFRIFRLDGEMRWLHAAGRRLDVAEGKARYVVGTVTDITERKAAADSLREAEERYRVISRATTDIVFDWEITSDRIRWNEARGVFFGYAANDLSSMSVLRYKIHPDDRQRVIDEFAQVFDGEKESYTSEHRLQDSAGKYLDVYACGSVIRDAFGRPARMIGSIQDVTERRYADAALRESEAINRAIVEASTDSVVLLDIEGRLLSVSRSGGLTRKLEDLTPYHGQHWTAAWPQHAWPGINDALKTARAGGTAQITGSFAYEGRVRWWEITVSPVGDGAGKPIKLVAIARDVTERREADEKLRRAATFDGLTALSNRACFQDKLADAVTSARTAGCRLGLLLLDVDDFKQVNDSLGHDAGDALLRAIASRLDLPNSRPQLVARLGGDEFAVLIEDIEDEVELGVHARAILGRMKRPLVHAGRVLDCNVTIGAAVFPDHGSIPDELLKSADIALYIAKDQARGGLTTFEPKHRDVLRERTAMLSIARSALKEGRVAPFYQPKLVLSDGRIDGFEALLRWRHPSLGMQLPGTISAAFEDLEVATSISRHMIDLVIGDMRQWLDRGLTFGHVAVNAAAAEFRSDDFAEGVLERLRAAGVPASCFQLEVTESVFLGKGAESVGRALKLLDSEGVRIALDDFGTGYASLRHLKQYPVHAIKIDQGFVQGMSANTDDAAIISAVINLGRGLGIDVIAEGIETMEQEARLRELGCGYGQGFLYSKAVPSSSVPDLLSGLTRT
jgi:diguanylate cyclase (GGDEF)-like protein/PAS domain S-box-containing protein